MPGHKRNGLGEDLKGLYMQHSFKLPTANKENRMMIPTWMFLVVAIVLAIVIGRLGTVLKERFAPNKA